MLCFKTSILFFIINKKAQTIMVYMSCRGEADTLKIIEKSIDDGKKLCAPVCIDKKTMVAKSFDDLSQLIKGAYGILEPVGDIVKNIDLILVPGVAFNENLHRIGYGAGYYDRFLSVRDTTPIFVPSELINLEEPTVGIEASMLNELALSVWYPSFVVACK